MEDVDAAFFDEFEQGLLFAIAAGKERAQLWTDDEEFFEQFDAGGIRQNDVAHDEIEVIAVPGKDLAGGGAAICGEDVIAVLAQGGGDEGEHAGLVLHKEDARMDELIEDWKALFPTVLTNAATTKRPQKVKR